MDVAFVGDSAVVDLEVAEDLVEGEVWVVVEVV